MAVIINGTTGIETPNLSVDSTTGVLQLPAGTTAERPVSPVAGYMRFNATLKVAEVYNGSVWSPVSQLPYVSSVSGNIVYQTDTSLVLSVLYETDTVDVTFYVGGVLTATVTGQTVTNGTVTVSVPSTIYNQALGTVVAIGIVNADGTPSSNTQNKTVIQLPTGGTITTSGGYRIHTFTSSGTFTVYTTQDNIEYLVIAGGGGGGPGAANSHGGGGGGAGGYRCSVTGESSGGGASAEAKISRSAGAYTVTVGAGGTANGGIGANSVFDTITSIGGGRGGSYFDYAPTSGGSGGGGSVSNNATIRTGAAGTTGQGYKGGDAQGGIYDTYGGSGGGAGGAGATAASGGTGVASNITGSSVTRAVGGAAGGLGGSAGTANTGNGGGGGYAGANSQPGGSGIVVIRYPF